MYFNSAAHDKAGDWQMLFSVATAPEARGRGFASRLLKEVIADCESRGRKGIVLTCKQHLIEFYARFGFKNEGVSQSIHGGARWYQMKLEF